MAYTPIDWKTGDVITADKLNNMESGIAGAGGVLVMNMSHSSTTRSLDKKCAEIKNAIAAGKTLLCRTSFNSQDAMTYMFLTVYNCEIFTDGGCVVTLYIQDQQVQFEAKTDNDYPITDVGE